MNEYTLEFKWEWYIDFQSFPQNGFVSRLFAETPKPKQSKLKRSLPFWDLTPLQCRLPSLGIKGMYYTRGKIGAPMLISTPGTEFVTYDPNCYEHDSKKYDSLHDRHLRNYYKSKAIRKFLRKMDILDEEDYPKCSIAEMNQYRIYLYRLHKDAVKREYNKALELREEKNLWKTAQKNLILNYFNELKYEDFLRKTCVKRKELARQQRLKELKPLQLLRNWDKRLKQIQEKAKDDKIRKDNMKELKMLNYKAVLERGMANAMDLPMRTLVRMRTRYARFQERRKNKNNNKEVEEKFKAECAIFKKAKEQYDKLERYKQLVILNDKGKEITRKKKQLEYIRTKKKFEEQLQCRKMKIKPAVTLESPKEKELRELNEQKHNKYKRKVNNGLPYILQVLSVLEKKEFGKVTEATKMIAPNAQENILMQIGHQMIRRAILINLRFLIRHFTTTLLNYCLSPSKDLSKVLPPAYEQSCKYYPTEKCLREADLIPDPDQVTHAFVPHRQNVMEEVTQSINTCGLRAFLVRKQQLLSTMLTNARCLFDLIEDRVRLLKTIPDPYYNVPYLKEEIMKERKTVSVDELTDRLINLLTIEDKNRFYSPASGLGEIANLLAYARLAVNYKILLDDGHTPTDDVKINVKDAFNWNRILEIHALMKRRYENIENEKYETGSSNTWDVKSMNQ